MKKNEQNNQCAILVIAAYLGITGPYSERNNKAYKLLGGRYDKLNNRWLVPDTAANREIIEEMFGAGGQNVIVELTEKCLDVDGSRLMHGGYVVASWHDVKKTVVVLPGVDLAAGSWDTSNSEVKATPCFAGPGAFLHVVVRRDYALSHGLKILTEAPEETAVNPLAPYANSDLQAELEARGYRVEPIMF